MVKRDKVGKFIADAFFIVCFFILLLTLVFVSWRLYGLFTVEKGLSSAPTPYQVARGETLWGIATREYPGEHTGEMVFEIRKLNPGIDPGLLRAGQMILLPSYSK